MSSVITISKNVEATIKDQYADPHPYGYYSFALTCILFGISNAGFFTSDSMLVAMALFFGGSCEIIGGVLCLRKGHFLNGFAFVAWGFFWISYAIMTLLISMSATVSPTLVSQAWYLAVWGLMTVFMFVNSIYYLELAAQIFYASVYIWFFLLAFGFGLPHQQITYAAGWFMIFSGVLAFYCGSGHLISFGGRKKIPLGQNYCCSKRMRKPESENHYEEQIKGGLDHANGI